MVAPEALLAELAHNDSYVRSLIDSAGPLIAPYDVLVNEDGWLVDPSSNEPTAPFDHPELAPDQRIANAMLVACDFAVRRGASVAGDLSRLLERESPIGVVASGGTSTVLEVAVALGIAVGSASGRLMSFARRARAHAELAFPCDPVLSFQPRTLDWDMGDNSLSSFIVHNDGDRDGVTIAGDVSERWGVAVGFPSSTPVEALANMESDVAAMPSFLSGVSSRLHGHALEVGWAAGEAPEIEMIGECMRVWSKALFDLEAVDVRIVFAPPRGQSAVLTEMRERARALRAQREAIIASHTDPETIADSYWTTPAGA